jgi:hypothetical protein
METLRLHHWPHLKEWLVLALLISCIAIVALLLAKWAFDYGRWRFYTIVDKRAEERVAATPLGSSAGSRK